MGTSVAAGIFAAKHQTYAGSELPMMSKAHIPATYFLTVIPLSDLSS
jgi:hypothetical protein